MRYEILSHTGDVKIRAFGRTKEELFSNATRGMFQILNPKFSPYGGSPEGREARNPEKRSIKIQSSDINSLLVDFLNEVNYLRVMNGEIYDKIKFTKFSDTVLEGELTDRKVQEFGEDIKAVTFHELDIHQNPEGLWETVVVFDV
jgi:SHS2 domain-containing protein